MSVTSVAFSQQSVLSLGNYSANLAGGFTVQGLQVLARRCPELKWEQLLSLDLLPALPAPSQTEEAPAIHCQVGCRR